MEEEILIDGKIVNNFIKNINKKIILLNTTSI